MRRPSFTSFFVFAAFASAQSVVYYGYADPHNTCVLLGWSEGARFVQAAGGSPSERTDSAAASVLQHFSVDMALRGVSQSGAPVQVRIKEKRGKRDFEAYTFKLSPTPNLPKDEGVLFGPVAPPIRVVPTSHPKLSTEVDNTLRREADRLARRVVDNTYELSRPSSYTVTLGVPSVWQVRGTSNLAVTYPVHAIVRYDATEAGSRDDRASVFFLYSPREKRILRGEFGHPEWEGGAAGDVLTIKPEFFFTLRGGNEVYFLADRYWGWEDWGHGIFSMETGKEVLYCR